MGSAMKRLRRVCALVLLTALMLTMTLPLAPRAEAAEMKTAIGTVTASALRLRQGPSTSTAILATAYRGDMVVIIRQEGDWYKVVYNLKVGYMHGDYLTLDEVKNINLGNARFDYATNVRTNPTVLSPIITCAPKGSTCYIIGFNKGWFKITYNNRTGYVRSDLVTLLQSPSSNYGGGSGGSQEGGGALAHAGMTKNEKLMMIFGSTSISDCRRVYANAEEARPHMVSITVKTWDINSSGSKYTRTWSLLVHENIAPTMQAIFDEIYALPEKPPIHSLGGYRWAGLSEHSCGLAVDINPNENYYCDPNGRPLTGSFFDPDNNPYSIPVGGSVDQIFARYGFTRGIYWNSGYRDYMHYSFFGT